MRWFKSMLFILLLLSSCTPKIEIDSVEKQLFMEETEVGCYRNGAQFIVYRPGFYQLSINNKRRMIRIQTYDQKEYYHMTMDSYPRSIGVNVLAQVSVGAMGESSDYTFLFECSKMEDGKLWLWNNEAKLGVIMPLYVIS